MTTIYSAQVVASFTTNTDQLGIEITASSSAPLKIRKIRIAHDDGTGLVTADYHKKVKLVIESVAGTGGNTYTPIALDDNATASVSTVKTGAFTPGTISTTIDVISPHDTTDLYWAAADDDDKIVVKPSGIFGVIVNPAN